MYVHFISEETFYSKKNDSIFNAEGGSGTFQNNREEKKIQHQFFTKSI